MPTMRDTNTHYGDQVTRAMNRPFLTAAILLSFLTATISAQDLERHDTLTAAIKTDSRRVAETLGKMATSDEAVPRILLYIPDFEHPTQYVCV